MDMQNQPYNNTFLQPGPYRRSERMEITAMTLGIISLISCTCLYISIPCGALAIIFASLSRGGGMTYGARAQLGLILGIIGLSATIILYGLSFAVALQQYGSIEGILKASADMAGMDYNEMMQQLMP